MNSKLFKLSTLVMSFMVMNIYGAVKECAFRQMEMNIYATLSHAASYLEEPGERKDIRHLLNRLITDLEDSIMPGTSDCPGVKRDEKLSIEDDIEATLRFAMVHGKREYEREEIRNLLNKLNRIVKETTKK